MKRYKKLFEYDPIKMRQLAGNNKISKNNKNEVPPELLFYKHFIKTPKIGIKGDKVRAVLYDGKFYSLNNDHGIHINILSWLIFNKGLNVNYDQMSKWGDSFADKVPFLCLFWYKEEPDVIYYSETYTKNGVSKLNNVVDSKFGKYIKNAGLKLIKNTYYGKTHKRLEI